MVHRPFRLVEIFEVFRKYQIEPKHMRLVHPFVDREPNMVLIEGLKSTGNPMMTVDPRLLCMKSPASICQRFMIFMDIEILNKKDLKGVCSL